MTTLIITDEEATMFKKYMQYHDLFITMETQGVFSIGYGKAIFNFAGGILQNVVKEEVVFKR